MKAAIDEVKSELKSRLLYWNNLKSKKVKAAAIILFLGVIALKIFTTLLTFEWLGELLS